MRRSSLLIAVLVLASLVVPAPVLAETETSHFKSQSANAVFTTVDGCITTQVVIGGTQGYHYTASESPKEVLTSAFLTVFRSNTCTGETLLDVSGDVPLPANAFTGSRNSARLRATIDVYERVSNSFFDVQVDVRWTKTGAVQVERQHLRDVPGCILNQTTVFTNTPAQAAGRILVRGANVIPARSVEALLQTGHEIVVSQDCPEPG